MRRKSLIGAIVAASLITSPALAQSASDEGTPWAAWLVAAGVVTGWVLMVILDDDDDNDVPASP